MEKIFGLVLIMIFSGGLLSAQTNSFPPTGNVGIGTTSPGAKLSFNNLNDGSDGADGITWYSPTPLYYGIYRTAGSWLAPDYQQLKISFETGIVLNPGSYYGKSFVEIQGSGGLRIPSGKVGIGTASPIEVLHLKPLGSTAAWIGLEKDAGMETGINFRKAGNILFYLYSDNDDNDALKIQSTGLTGENDSAPRMLIPYDSKNLYFGLSGGSVAIGHKSPYSSSRLHVKASTDTPWNVISESSTNGRIIGLSHDGTKGIVAVSYLGNSGFSPLQFWTSNLARLTIDVAGNVGIGTSSPNEKLTVSGTIYGKEVKVDLSVPGPDYVFAKDYKLPSLQEVQIFINQHRHLPEIPSAKEMEAEGIKVGEMNMLLLKKVEELTLYLIQQQNEIEALKKALYDKK